MQARQTHIPRIPSCRSSPEPHEQSPMEPLVTQGVLQEVAMHQQERPAPTAPLHPYTLLPPHTPVLTSLYTPQSYSLHHSLHPLAHRSLHIGLIQSPHCHRSVCSIVTHPSPGRSLALRRREWPAGLSFATVAELLTTDGEPSQRLWRLTASVVVGC